MSQRIPDEIRDQIRQSYKDGTTGTKTLARMYGCSRDAIRRIVEAPPKPKSSAESKPHKKNYHDRGMSLQRVKVDDAPKMFKPNGTMLPTMTVTNDLTSAQLDHMTRSMESAFGEKLETLGVIFVKLDLGPQGDEVCARRVTQIVVNLENREPRILPKSVCVWWTASFIVFAYCYPAHVGIDPESVKNRRKIAGIIGSKMMTLIDREAHDLMKQFRDQDKNRPSKWTLSATTNSSQWN